MQWKTLAGTAVLDKNWKVNKKEEYKQDGRSTLVLNRDEPENPALSKEV